MEKNKLQKVLKYLVNPAIKQNQFNELWKNFLDTLNLTQGQVISAILDQFEKKGETLGLSEEELLALAEKLPSKPVRRLIYTKLSPAQQEKHAELSEDDIQKKELDWLDKSVIQGLHNEAHDHEQMQALLQKMAADGNSDYLIKLQGKMDAKDLMVLAQKIMDMGDAKSEKLEMAPPIGTTTANTAPYLVPLGDKPSWMKKKKKVQEDDDSSVDKKKALAKFRQPDFDQAKLTIGETNALGGDFYDLTLSIPVDVDFLKKDGMGELVHAAHDYIGERMGMWLGQPTVGGSDGRAKGGMKVIRISWQVEDPIAAYAMGANLDQWRGTSEVVPKEEMQGRLAYAEKAMKDATEYKANAQAMLAKYPEGEQEQVWKERYLPKWTEMLNAMKAKGLSFSAVKSRLRKR